MATNVSLTVNGQAKTLAVEEGRTLLEVLREDLGLTGTKYGCGEGACGACTVLLDGIAVRSCLVAAADAGGKSVVTIEGLAPVGALHPVQEAFLAEGAIQCGFCTPGLVLETAVFLQKSPHPSEAEIVGGLNSHICRCCGYPKIVRAVQHAAAGGGEKR